MLTMIETAHVRVQCDSCGVSAEVCGRRDLPVMARVAAVRKFHAIGWHLDPSHPARRSSSARAERESSEMGSGKWYCPGCAAKSHL
jgi:hypothetical protein